MKFFDGSASSRTGSCFKKKKFNSFPGSRQFVPKSSDFNAVVVSSVDDVGVENVVKWIEGYDDANVGVVKPARARR